MLERLFDAELVYRSEMEPVTKDGEGELIGSGDGTVAGPAIAGQLAWTLFERPGRFCAGRERGEPEVGRRRDAAV